MKIFLVDDEAPARLIAQEALRGLGHELMELETGTALLAAAAQRPDLLLLDIAMPEMDGISACRALRQAGDEHAMVIFISAHDDLESRLAAYDAGGMDFLVKPYAREELMQKVRVAEALLRQRTELAAQASFARETAFTAMASMGEMGSVLHFLRASFACREPAQLAAAMTGTLAELGLHALVEIRLPGRKYCFSPEGVCTPMETSILGHAAGMERLFQFHDRLVVNYPSLTLVAQKLPMHDIDRVGRLRDHLALLAEGAEARVQAMINEDLRQAQAKGILEAITALTQALARIERSQAETRLRALQIDAAYLEELVGAFVHLGLTDMQENTLADMAEKTHMQLATLLDEDHSISDQLRAVTEQLRRLGAG